jgi:hypothetical protein
VLVVKADLITDTAAIRRIKPRTCVAALGTKVASHLRLIPREHNSGRKQRRGTITEEGNSFMRNWLVEAAQIAERCDPGMPSEYLHRCHRKAMSVAKVAIQLYRMLLTNRGYPQFLRVERVTRGCPLAVASYAAELIGRPRPDANRAARPLSGRATGLTPRPHFWIVAKHTASGALHSAAQPGWSSGSSKPKPIVEVTCTNCGKFLALVVPPGRNMRSQ